MLLSRPLYRSRGRMFYFRSGLSRLSGHRIRRNVTITDSTNDVGTKPPGYSETGDRGSLEPQSKFTSVEGFLS